MISQFIGKLLSFYDASFFTSLSAACCSLGILTLAQCGGSSSDAEGLAPSTIGSKVLNMQVTGITDAAITLPAIFDMTTGDNGAFIIQTQGEDMNMWNGAGIYSYTKTGKNTAELILSYNRNSGSSSEPNTLMSTIRIPQLTFENATHASSGEGGASISYMQAQDWTPIPIDGITISVNIISQS